MAEYASEKGVKVQTVAGDPPAPFEGQVWYNSSTGSHRVKKGALVNAWATGGDLNTARTVLAGAGTQTAALGFGGYPGVTNTGATESYNGSTWTEVNDLNTARRGLAGVGTQTSALGFGGFLSPSTAVTESWNGTNWTEVNDLNTPRQGLGAAGSNNTAALAFSGFVPPITAVTESWNGTSWTEVNDFNTGRSYLAGCGTQTAALGFGGYAPTAPGRTGATESWNGTNWTEVNDLNTARNQLAGAGADNTAALAFGGLTPAPAGSPTTKAVTESWNGTNWTEVNDLNTARRQLGGAGANNTSALAIGGNVDGPAATAATEEWSETGGTQSIASS